MLGKLALGDVRRGSSVNKFGKAENYSHFCISTLRTCGVSKETCLVLSKSIIFQMCLSRECLLHPQNELCEVLGLTLPSWPEASDHICSGNGTLSGVGTMEEGGMKGG